jgi:hypothetical protein
MTQIRKVKASRATTSTATTSTMELDLRTPQGRQLPF